jgi:hypothetical protein
VRKILLFGLEFGELLLAVPTIQAVGNWIDLGSKRLKTFFKKIQDKKLKVKNL